MGKIFISYRRSESIDLAGRLYDRLKERFGSDQVFRDIDKIEPGANYIDVLNHALGSCSVLIAVIGKTWLTTSEATGRRRLDNPEDLTRLEIKTALERKIQVIPVLVQGAAMCSRQELPEDLRELSYKQALELSSNRWDYDINLLIECIEKGLGVPPISSTGQSKTKDQPSDGSSSSLKKLVVGAIVVGVLGVGIVINWYNGKDIKPTVQTNETALNNRTSNKPAPRLKITNKNVDTLVKPDKPAPSVAKKPISSRYTVSLSEDRGTVILSKGSGDEKHISLDPDRVQKIYTAPGGGWCLAVFKVRGQPVYGAMPINLTRGAEGVTEELATLPEQVTFAGKEIVVKLSGGEVRRIHLN